jgi:hypothetical protein
VKDLIKEKRCSKQKRAKRSKERILEKYFKKQTEVQATDFKTEAESREGKGQERRMVE